MRLHPTLLFVFSLLKLSFDFFKGNTRRIIAAPIFDHLPECRIRHIADVFLVIEFRRQEVCDWLALARKQDVTILATRQSSSSIRRRFNRSCFQSSTSSVVLPGGL